MMWIWIMHNTTDEVIKCQWCVKLNQIKGSLIVVLSWKALVLLQNITRKHMMFAMFTSDILLFIVKIGRSVKKF